jgi:hypothetical protein
MAVRRWTASAVVALVLAACGSLSGPPAPTGKPAATSPPTTAPTAGPTGASAERPPEAITIERPGPGSSAVSPLRISGVADPTFESQLGVRLLAMDGRPIAEGSAQIQAPIGERGPFDATIAFDVDSDQPALLQVYDSSARDGGITHLGSAVVRLLPSGTALVHEAQTGPEQIQILGPVGGQSIAGGRVDVSGFGLASFENTLVVEVLDANGNRLDSAPVTVGAPDLGQPGPFAAALFYTVDKVQPGRIIVRDPSVAFGGAVHISSVEVQLQP